MSDDDDDDKGSMSFDCDIEEFIDDNEEVQQHAIQQNTLLPVTTPSNIESASAMSVNSHERERQQTAQLKRYNREKAILNKLMTYISQCVVLGFNSQKYDIPLFRNYLASSQT